MAGSIERIIASDGHELGLYTIQPGGRLRGAIVVIQEIFGVNAHIRSVADGYAADGYATFAPALFDRIEPGFEVGYAPADIERGRAMKAASPTELALLDIDAALNAAKGHASKVGVVGYCWGGFLAFAAATRLDGIAGAVSYYGGGIGSIAAEKPRCPVQFHFGEQDGAIPKDEVELLRRHQPDQEFHIYPAGHGFNCDQRGSYHADSARLARSRALAFFQRHVG